VWSFPSEVKCLNLAVDNSNFQNLSKLDFTITTPSKMLGDFILMENEHLPYGSSFYWCKKPSTLIIHPKNLELAKRLLGKT
jgi:hypothetical protein